MTKLIVGCPTALRSWILPTWKKYIDEAVPEGVDASFVFAVPESDTETLEMLGSWEHTQIVPTEEVKLVDEREWADLKSYDKMVTLRNSLLHYVRMHSPDYYLSIDSDILLNKDALTRMLDLCKTGADAASSMTFLDVRDPHCTNAASWKDQTRSGFRRHDSYGQYEVDVIMAIKLMGPLAYSTDYKFDRFGEDFGWSSNLKDMGGKVLFDATTRSKHVMKPKYLDLIDERVGY